MKWTMDQQIGQMLWFGWHGETPEASRSVLAQARALLEEFQVGGIILMGRNVSDPGQVSRLTTSLQAASTVPLFMGTDQEGGTVARLALPGLTFSGNMALGALDDPFAVTAVTTAMGEQLAAMGINVDFAPVLDVNNNPANPIIGVRAFGEDPQRVARLGVAALQGFARANVIACVKHFPGHGDTSVDSHLALPVQPASRARLDEVELVPFRAAVAAGAPMLMTAHILFPALDEQWPATLSSRVLTGLLREELGYRGVVVTDCLEMQGIAGHIGVEEAAVAAVEAGADCLLACHTLETQRRIHRALRKAVSEGRISSSRIEASVERILQLKQASDLERRRKTDPASAERIVGAERYRDLERGIARRAVTVVRDDCGWLPLSGGPVVVIGAERVVSGLVGALGVAGIPSRAVSFDHASVAAGEAVLILAVLPDEPHGEEGPALARRWLEAGRQVIIIAVREPYPLCDYSEAPCLVATYGYADGSLLALAEALAGKATPEGRLPVTVAVGPRTRYNSETDQ
jgi:beta-N-acetylhexosaminidase